MKKIIFIILLAILILVFFDYSIKNMVVQESSEIYTYKGNANADGIEIDEVIKLENNKFNMNCLTEIINRLVKKQFLGIDIEIVEIKNNLLTINLKDKEKYVVEYVNMGSSGSKICSDILIYSLLQPESNIKNWVNGLKILINGEADVEGDHFNFVGIYDRKQTEKIMATIKDYGYEDTPVNYDDKYIVNLSGQKFVITPANENVEIIISEVIFSEYGFYEGKELYRTNKSLMFAMELSEGIPYISVKLKNGDRTSTWLPTYNGKDSTLIVPAEFKII